MPPRHRGGIPLVVARRVLDGDHPHQEPEAQSARAVAGPPRKVAPSEDAPRLAAGVVRDAQLASFWEVQAAVLMLLLLYTFCRSETPCPASYTGEGAFDQNKHLRVCDVRVENSPGLHARVRLKIVKQDQRMERPAAQVLGGDWVHVGRVSAEETACLLFWLQVLFRLHGGARPDDSPFFLARDGRTPGRLTVGPSGTGWRRSEFLVRYTLFSS